MLISQPCFEALLAETLASITPEEGRSAACNNRDFLYLTLMLMQLSDQNLHSLQLLDVVHEKSVESGSDS